MSAPSGKIAVQLPDEHWSRQEVVTALHSGVAKSYVRGVEGDVAEFGTFTGFSAQVLSAGIRDTNRIYENKFARIGIVGKKRLHLFDSFEGLPETSAPADQTSPLYESGLWRKGAFNASSHKTLDPNVTLSSDMPVMDPKQLALMCASFLPAEDIFTYQGWFSDTVPKLDKQLKFAMLHIDCDLYSSTIDVLENLILGNHISNGALIYFDDWNCNLGSPEFGERKAWDEIVEKYKVKFSPEGPYGFFGHSLIYHGRG